MRASSVVAAFGVGAVVAALGVGGCLLVTHEDDSIYGGEGEGDGSLPGREAGPPVHDASVTADAGSGPTSGDAGSDGSSADASADGGADASLPCQGRAGPAGIRVGSYCVDSTEVTVGQYVAFLDSGVVPPLPSECADASLLQPNNLGAQLAGPQTVPFTEASWCAAYAYCAWAGKHMCGAIGDGGSLAANNGGPQIQDFDDPTRSEWAQACTFGGTREYPYGGAFDAGACNGADRPGVNGLTDAGSLPGCVGGYPGIFDMSGNAYEWINACEGDGTCMLLGGSWQTTDTSGGLACDSWLPQPLDQNEGVDIGIRCCSN